MFTIIYVDFGLERVMCHGCNAKNGEDSMRRVEKLADLSAEA
jgi:hypothetical protein